MQRKKVNDKLKNKVKELDLNRNQIEDYLNNFLNNYSKIAIFMHSRIKVGTKKEELKIPAFQYLSSIISCWETFFRDVFVFLISIDANLRDSLILELNIQESNIEDIDFGGYLASCFNFQNLDDTVKAFMNVFNQDIFEYVSNETFLTFMPNKDRVSEFCLIKTFSDYQTTLEAGMNYRHKIIHDANFMNRATLDYKFIQKAETVFLLIPQLITKSFSDKYSLPRFLINNNGVKYDFLFLIDDLIADDWVIVSDESIQ